jgi:two-component system response regulator RegA
MNSSLERADEREANRISKHVMTLARVEWEYIQRIVSDCEGNISQAARLLGLHKRSLQRKLGKGPPAR